MQKRKFLLTILIILIILLYTLSCYCYATNESDARLAILTSEERVVGCYRKALEVEKRDVNISSLLTDMNNAGFFLSKAHSYYKIGNYSEAIYYAELVKEKLALFDAKVNDLESYHHFLKKQAFNNAAIYVVIRVFLVIFVNFLFWRYIKDRYIQIVLKMKPKINE